MSRQFISGKIAILMLTFCVLRTNCEVRINNIDVPDSTGRVNRRDRNAFSALRSCHQVLQGESGEFFSPDYLCSNPALWCNWTIQAQPGKRLQLYLEDFTPSHACHLKTDQIHLDESPGVTGGHRILEKCWRQVEYTSLSNTVHVVLLIGGNPTPPHRGFYGHYKTFGPPTPPTPDDSSTEMDKAELGKGDKGHLDSNDVVEEVESSVKDATATLISLEEDDSLVPLYDQIWPTPTAQTKPVNLDRFLNPPSVTTKPHSVTVDSWDIEESWDMAAEKDVGEIRNTKRDKKHQHMSSGSHVEAPHAEKMSNRIISANGPGSYNDDAPSTDASFSSTGRPNQWNDENQVPPSAERSEQPHHVTSAPGDARAGDVHPHVFDDEAHSAPKGSPRSPTMTSNDRYGLSRKITNASTTAMGHHEEAEVYGSNVEPGDKGAKWVKVSQVENGNERASLVETSDADGGKTSGSDFEERVTDFKDYRLNAVKSDSRDKEKVLLLQNPRNKSNHKHFPGDVLFEISIEVSLHHTQGENLDHLMAVILPFIQTMIQKELGTRPPKSISTKRTKRLRSGVLYILWVQYEGEGTAIHRVLHSAAQGLQDRTVSLHDGGDHGRVASISIADVNECGTQSAACDANAVCVNHFGSYACRCRPGYEDMSRGGPAGTLCVDPDHIVCEEVPSPALLKGMYAVCVLLSLLIVLLLFAVAVLYRRHHRGVFLPRCWSSRTGTGTITDNNNNPNATSRPLPPPPPPPPPPLHGRREDQVHPKGSCRTMDLPLLRFSSLSPPIGFGVKVQEDRDKF